MKRASNFLTAFLTLSIGCSTGHYSAKTATYEDVSKQSMLSGVGIESQDINNMTREMVTDIISAGSIVSTSQTPMVIIDSKYFKNESSSRLNKKQITDKLRVGLNKAAAGSFKFVSREHLDMLIDEKKLAMSGITDADESVYVQAGAEYRLGGRITSLDQINPKTGEMVRYHQILFEMINLKEGTIAWTGIYEIRKYAREGIEYR